VAEAHRAFDGPQSEGKRTDLDIDANFFFGAANFHPEHAGGEPFSQGSFQDWLDLLVLKDLVRISGWVDEWVHWACSVRICSSHVNDAKNLSGGWGC
jgi:hypothetical protein